MVKDGKHAVAKTQYLGRASAIHARTGIAERSDAFRGLWGRKGLARRSSTDESSLEALTGLQEGPKNALPDGTRYEYDPILKRTVEVTPSGERFPVTLVDGKPQRDSEKTDRRKGYSEGPRHHPETRFQSLARNAFQNLLRREVRMKEKDRGWRMRA